MKNRILFPFILLLVGLGFSPLPLKAQFVNNGAQVTLVNKGIIYVNGDIINQRSNGGIPNFSAALGPQVIVTGNIINNSGTEFFFAGDSSLVVMKGSSLQLIQGTDNVNFFRLRIANASDSVKLERSISVIDSLMLQSGFVNLNGKEINLNATGYLTGETANTYIFGDSGIIFLQRPIAPNSSLENIGGLGAFIQSNSNLGMTTIARSHQGQNVANVSSGLRYFDISTSFAVTDQTLVFNYFDHELNGIAESDLQLYHSLDNGQTWTIQNAIKSTSLNSLSDSTSQFPARYTMADDVCKLNPVLVDLGNDTALCFGDSITLNALNPGADFIWSTNETAQTIKVDAGNYSVIVTAANGCVGLDSIIVTSNPLPIVQTSNDTVICSGQPLTIGDLNSQLPNTNSYLWNTAATTQTISVNTVTARIDTFIFTIITAAGCSISDSIRVEINDQPIVNLGNDTALCQTELLTLNATNVGATYLWSTGATTPTIQVNSTSTYSVIVTNGICQAFDTVNVIKSNLISSIQKTDINCFGNTNGTAEVTGLNGITPYSYVWSTSSTTKAITNLAAGKYYATITDSIGCTVVSDTVEILEPTEITINFAVTNESCVIGNDGSIDLTATGGTGALSFNWTTSTGSVTISTNEDLNNLTAGKYIVTVTDANGCTKVDSASIIRPNGFTATEHFADISCNGANDASVNYSLSGGAAPFTFTWSNASTDSVQTNLSAGTYSVLILDANNCSYRDTVTVINPPLILSALAGTNLTCFKNVSGAINLTTSGGTGVLTFKWRASASSTTISTTEDLTNLSAGKYIVTITDGNACQKLDSITLTEPNAITSNLTAIAVSCNGNSDGSISSSIMGGTQPYTYAWSTSTSTATISTNSSITNLTAGKYLLTVTDNNSCQKLDSITITEPGVLSISVDSSFNVSCFSLVDGRIFTSTTGGTLPYTYLWDNNSTTEDITNLSAGNYQLTVTDVNACSKVVAYTIVENSAISLTTFVVNANCNLADGNATVTATGGISPYSYLWVSTGDTTATDSNLSAGNYMVSVTDSLGCVATTTASISNNSGPTLTLDSTKNIHCFGDSTGEIALTISGGSTPYTYLWSNGSAVEDQNNLPEGNYSLTVTDNNNCLLTGNYSLTEGDSIRLTLLTTDLSCSGSNDGLVSINSLGGTGKFDYLWSNAATSASVSNLSMGKYYVTVTDSLGCFQTDSADVAEPNLLIATLDSTDLTCNGDFTGSVDLTVSGGTTPYTFNWSTSTNPTTIAITEDISNLSSATYYVTITDRNNCQIIDSTTINQPDTIGIAASIQHVLCATDSSGTIALSITGGTQPYSYSWTTSTSSATYSTDSISKLIAGTYSVTITDASSCLKTASYQITEPSILSVLLNASSVNCGGDSTGMITSVVSGGVAPYGYAWSTSTSSVIFSTANSIQNVKAGTYHLVVTDANGCQLLDSATINQNPIVQAYISKTDITCNGNADGTLTTLVSGGTAPYTYLWNDFSTSQNRNNLNAGNYSLTVSDNLGCSVVLADTIVEPTVIKVLADTNDVTCSGAGNASIQLSVSGGVAPYSYKWSNTSITDSIGGLAGGTYLVTITDQNSCFTTRSYSLTNPKPIKLNATVANIGCGSSAKGGSIRLAATGGTTPYTFSWSNGATTAINDSLGVGNYSVTLTDASGCMTSANFTIQLEGNPIFARYLSASFATSDDTLSFVNLSYPSPANYTWNLGDSTVLNQTDVLHSYRSRRIDDGDSSFYDVRLLADNGTCVDSVNKRITIRNLGPLRKGLDSISMYAAPFIEEVNLFPVPANNVLNYKLLLGLEDDLTVRIYTLDQKLLKTYSLSKAKEHQGQFGISELAKGLYIITFITSTDQQSIRFIKL